MSLIKWNEQYSIDHENIDNQHKKLIDLLNQIADAMSIGKGRDVVGRVLNELVEYTVYHFQTEERLFRRYCYPDFERHRKIHDELTAKALDLREMFNEGNKMITVDVMQFLSDWLNTHILYEDKKFGLFLKIRAAEPRDQEKRK